MNAPPRGTSDSTEPRYGRPGPARPGLPARAARHRVLARLAAALAGRPRRSRRGLCLLLAGLVPAALAAAAMVPAAASASVASPASVAKPADLTRGFDINNFSTYRLKLVSVTGGPFDSTPPIGSVLEPGQAPQHFEMQYNFTHDERGEAEYETVPGNRLVYAELYDSGFNEPSTACYPASTPCSKTSQSLTFLINDPGTVITIPAGQGQQQAATLQQYCNNDNAATCKFTAIGDQAHITSPPHVPTHGYGMKNNTDRVQEIDYEASDTVGTTDSIDISTKLGLKIAKVVNIEVEVRYGHEWTQEDEYTSAVHLSCGPHRACWIEAEDPLLRTTGNFTMTLGNVTWNLDGIYFDSPDPGGRGFFDVTDCSLSEPGCPPSGTVPRGKSQGPVGSGIYLPSGRLS
jgi:hypothetical protein